MKILLYCFIPAVFLSDFRTVLQEMGKASKVIELMPELMAGLLLVLVLFELTKRRQILIAPKYWIIFVVFVLHMLIGAILNSMSGAAMVSGIRIYFKYLPLFILPAVIQLSEKDIINIFKLILFFAFIQIPVTIYQRIFIFPSSPTGDVIRGTAQVGAIMSIFLICTITMGLAFALRKRLKKTHFIIITLLLFFPTTINETKGTIIIIPFAIAAVAFFSSKGIERYKYLLVTLGASAVLLIMFTVGYNIMFPNKLDGGLVAFFTEGEAYKNVYKDKDVADVKTVGRIDSIILAYKGLRPDITKLAIGLGIGNLSNLGISDDLGGEYRDIYEEFGANVTTISYLLWEVGVIGVTLFLILLFMIFSDARKLRYENDLSGVVALGWLGVLLALFISLIYKNLLFHSVIGYLFMFVSGLIASTRMRKVYTRRFNSQVFCKV